MPASSLLSGVHGSPFHLPALAASPRGRLRKTGKEGSEADLEMLVRLTDPSHQGREDLQVFGLLDVKEGEGSEEEREDGLVTKTRVRRCRGQAHVALRACGDGTLFTQPPAIPRAALTQVCAGSGRGSLGSGSIAWRVPGTRAATETETRACLLHLTLVVLRRLSRQIAGYLLGTWPCLLLFSVSAD